MMEVNFLNVTLITFSLICAPNFCFLFAQSSEHVNATSTKGASYKIRVGYKSIGNPVSEFKSSTRASCIATCEFQNGCLEINFVVGDGISASKCQLFDSKGNKDILVKDERTSFMEKMEKMEKVEKVELAEECLLEGPQEEINLIGLDCNQISDYTVGAVFTCNGAIDGNHGTVCTSTQLTCSHTNSEAQPWLEIDLGIQRTIAKVMLHNRAQGPQALDDFTIRVQDQPMPDKSSSQICVQNVLYAVESIRTLECIQPVTGRYLVVQIETLNSVLVLVEVRAFGC